MRYKNYKVGDRIFYKCWDGSIATDIVIKVEEKTYISDGGWLIHYQKLTIWQEGGCSDVVENYNCLPQNSPECKELVKKYKKFDKQKDSIVQSIIDILSPWDKQIQEDIIKSVQIKMK